MARHTSPASLVDSILDDLDDAREGIEFSEAIEFPTDVRAMFEERPVQKDDSFISTIIYGSIFR